MTNQRDIVILKIQEARREPARRPRYELCSRYLWTWWTATQLLGLKTTAATAQNMPRHKVEIAFYPSATPPFSARTARMGQAAKPVRTPSCNIYIISSFVKIRKRRAQRKHPAKPRSRLTAQGRNQHSARGYAFTARRDKWQFSQPHRHKL